MPSKRIGPYYIWRPSNNKTMDEFKFLASNNPQIPNFVPLCRFLSKLLQLFEKACLNISHYFDLRKFVGHAHIYFPIIYFKFN